MFRNCILATGMDTPFEIDRKLATSADRLTPRKFTLKRALPSYKSYEFTTEAVEMEEASSLPF